MIDFNNTLIRIRDSKIITVHRIKSIVFIFLKSDIFKNVHTLSKYSNIIYYVR